MKTRLFLLSMLALAAAGCGVRRPALPLPARPADAPTGSEFAAAAAAASPDEREEMILREILAGNIPPHLRRLAAIRTRLQTQQGSVEVRYYVLPDYLAVGSRRDFVRVPMQPRTAQRIADSLGCFLSTPKICDEVYRAARVRLEPQPLVERREAFETFALHNDMIERQRKGRRGLIAGIKKDVVLTTRLARDSRDDRVALYGWHKPDGKPIQPLYTGHVDRYVDYSHGIRLVWGTWFVEGRPTEWRALCRDERLRPAVSDEQGFDFFAYPTIRSTP